MDDSPLVLELLGGALGNAGFVVDTAIDVAQLEEKRTTAPPDLILLDVQMPEVWGDDVATTLRAVYEVSVPIVLMSTLDVSELRRRADAASYWGAGTIGFVSKRDGVDKIVVRIAEILRAQTEEPAAPNKAGEPTATSTEAGAA